MPIRVRHPSVATTLPQGDINEILSHAKWGVPYLKQSPMSAIIGFRRGVSYRFTCLPEGGASDSVAFYFLKENHLDAFKYTIRSISPGE